MKDFNNYSKKACRASGGVLKYYKHKGQYWCGLGLGQWTASRSYNLLAFAKGQNTKWYTLDCQLAYMFGVDSRKTSLAKYRDSSYNDAKSAAYGFASLWEGNTSRGMSARQSSAKTAYNNLRDGKYKIDVEYGKRVLASADMAGTNGGILGDGLGFGNDSFADRFGSDGCGGIMKDKTGWTATGEFMDGEVNGAMCQYLSFNPDLIFETLGSQGHSQCGVYSCAYGYTVLTGKCRVSGHPASHQAVAREYNGGVFAVCQWGTMKLSKQQYSSSSERLAAIWEEIVNKKKPVMVTVQGSGENHFVLCIGFKKELTGTPGHPDPSDIVILDPAMSGERILCTYGNGYKKNFDGSAYGKMVYRFPDDATE